MLIVDDEPNIIDLLKTALADRFEISVAEDGLSALELIRKNEFETMICDMMMPGMSGMELFSLIENSNPVLAAYTIFITGGAFTPRASEFLEHPQRMVLEKPFSIADLRSFVERLNH